MKGRNSVEDLLFPCVPRGLVGPAAVVIRDEEVTAVGGWAREYGDLVEEILSSLGEVIAVN